MKKKAKLSNWLAFFFFIAVILFLVLFTKNKGSLAGVISDIKSIFGM